MDNVKKTERFDARRWAPRSEGVQYATEKEQRAITNSSRKKKAAWLKWEWCSAMDVSAGES